MKKFLIVLLFFPFIGFSQFTPQPSPGASLTQTIGVTKVYIEYSRPGVKGRTIFGNLLPYGKIWRTGANASTLIEVSNDVKIEGLPLQAGAYSILSFPYETYWEIVFCTNVDVTEETFSPECEVLRVKVPVVKNSFTETFTIDFSEIKDDEASISFSWENCKTTIKMTVENGAAIMNAALQLNDETAGAFQQAAEYMLNKKINLEEAYILIDKSVYLKETFRNVMIKAQILNELGKYKAALEQANKAKLLGSTTPIYSFFETQLTALITDLKKKTI